MVAPILLGILGAGLATQAGYHGFAKPAFERKRGERAQGILDDLPEDAGIDAKRQALMQGGLLDPSRYAEIGFEDQSSQRDFLEALRLANTNNAAAMDRTQVTQSGADRRQEDQQAFTSEQNDLNRQHDQTVLDASQWREADDQFWAVEDALDAATAPLNNNIAMTNRALEIAEELEKLGRGSSVTNPERYNSLLFELSEIDNELFFERKRQVYGEAEPNAEQLQALKDSFVTFTDGSNVQPWRRWTEIKQQYNRRNAEYAAGVSGAIDRAQQTIDRLNQRVPNGGWALENPDSYRVQPRSTGGGVPDNQVTKD